jgi:hypothetical protein
MAQTTRLASFGPVFVVVTLADEKSKYPLVKVQIRK